MLELLFSLLELFLEFFFEAAFELAAEFLRSLIWRGVAAVLTHRVQKPCAGMFAYVFLGGVVGGLSLLVFPHRWFIPPGSLAQCCHQSHPAGLECRWWALHYASGTEGHANGEFWLWFAFALGWPRPFLLHSWNKESHMPGKRGIVQVKSIQNHMPGYAAFTRYLKFGINAR